MTRAAAALLALATLVPSSPAAAAQGGAEAKTDTRGGVFPDPKEIPDEEAKGLVDALEKALEAKDEEKVKAALAPMVEKRNKAFLPELKKLLVDRRQAVAALAATAIGSQGDKGAGSLLVRVVSFESRDKKGVMQDPDLKAAAVESLGRLGIATAFKQVEELATAMTEEPEVRFSYAKTVARACVRYYGLTKEKRAVSWLIDETDRPNLDGPVLPTSPPADYWKARQEIWEVVRWEVVWALKEITGKEFETKRRWQEWFKEEGKKAGYK
jgi:HEAT repeat protein